MCFCKGKTFDWFLDAASNRFQVDVMFAEPFAFKTY